MSTLKPAILVFGRPKYHLASEVLKAARRVIRSERRWITGQLAAKPATLVNKDGNTYNDYADSIAGEGAYLGLKASTNFPLCATTAKEAVAFCALGAVKFVNGPMERSATAFLREAAKALLVAEEIIPAERNASNEMIFTVNDSDASRSNHRRVLKMFRLAIKAAKQAEAGRAAKN